LGATLPELQTLGKYFEVSSYEFSEEFDPICEVLATVNYSSVPWYIGPKQGRRDAATKIGLGLIAFPFLRTVGDEAKSCHKDDKPAHHEQYNAGCRIRKFALRSNKLCSPAS
jgi:hypothetical protein